MDLTYVQEAPYMVITMGPQETSMHVENGIFEIKPNIFIQKFIM